VKKSGRTDRYKGKDTTDIGPPISKSLLPYTISLNQPEEQFQVMFLTLIEMGKQGFKGTVHRKNRQM
jgi:hypothetical protein